jgi:hypothetical protein
MKKLAILFAGLFIMAISVQNVNAQTTAASESSAEIVQALTIVNNEPLAFGYISTTNTAGSVTIDNAGSRSGFGGAAPVTGGIISAAKFTIEGPAGETINVNVDNTTFKVFNGAAEMDVTLTQTDVDAANSIASTGTGTIEILFGGTITVGANQTIGFYENDEAFEVTVNYN